METWPANATWPAFGAGTAERRRGVAVWAVATLGNLYLYELSEVDERLARDEYACECPQISYAPLLYCCWCANGRLQSLRSVWAGGVHASAGDGVSRSTVPFVDGVRPVEKWRGVQLKAAEVLPSAAASRKQKAPSFELRLDGPGAEELADGAEDGSGRRYTFRCSSSVHADEVTTWVEVLNCYCGKASGVIALDDQAVWVRRYDRGPEQLRRELAAGFKPAEERLAAIVRILAAEREGREKAEWTRLRKLRELDLAEQELAQARSSPRPKQTGFTELDPSEFDDPIEYMDRYVPRLLTYSHIVIEFT